MYVQKGLVGLGEAGSTLQYIYNRFVEDWMYRRCTRCESFLEGCPLLIVAGEIECVLCFSSRIGLEDYYILKPLSRKLNRFKGSSLEELLSLLDSFLISGLNFATAAQFVNTEKSARELEEVYSNLLKNVFPEELNLFCIQKEDEECSQSLMRPERPADVMNELAMRLSYDWRINGLWYRPYNLYETMLAEYEGEDTALMSLLIGKYKEREEQIGRALTVVVQRWHQMDSHEKHSHQQQPISQKDQHLIAQILELHELQTE